MKLKNIIWGLYKVLNPDKKQKPDNREIKKRIDALPEPENDYDRTDNNFYSNNIKKHVNFMDIMGIFGILAVLVVLIAKIIIPLRKHDVNAVLIHAENRQGDKYEYKDRFPDSLNDEFKVIQVLELETFPKFFEGRIGIHAFIYWMKFVKRHPFYGFLNFRALINIMAINKILNIYHPQAIISYRSERSSMSNLITGFCEMSGAEYICFMHGEMLTDPETSFVRFSRMYVWDEHYIEILKWGRATESKWYIYLPEIYKFTDDPDGIIKYDILYIFRGNAEKKDKNAELIIKSLSELQNKKIKCKVRPHPRWSDISEIQRLAGQYGIDYEDPWMVSVKKSLTESRCVAGILSTVLTEAYYAGKPIILDDVSDISLYNSLEESMYILIHKPHEYLSDLFNNPAGSAVSTHAYD